MNYERDGFVLWWWMEDGRIVVNDGGWCSNCGAYGCIYRAEKRHGSKVVLERDLGLQIHKEQG